MFAVGRGWLGGKAAKPAPTNSYQYPTRCHSERNEMKRKNLKIILTGLQ